ncbi:MAG: disulfide bond formation protein B [Gammaproteobacteria bacterium]|nr:disulfide bond formation protein B [Gammaproteobacteria bacterium]MBU1443301.1 disulfide bond formation protein B [Gammaproteobacteria bacterium]MBU2284923.1 disulfide bond formation protein B [Gammaproteobacteria bacterium]MBU2409267.1 disulfide bond formation protein B [Gammaproteobacteria bacterium]
MGSLFFGEVMGLTPCVLCWYQRIAMFPIVLVLGMGLLLPDCRSALYALCLACAGWMAALYHCLLYWGVIPSNLAPCGKSTSCSEGQLALAGWPSIPLLSLVAFTLIVAFLTAAVRKSPK